jgi:Tol biopolymer transport system component
VLVRWSLALAAAGVLAASPSAAGSRSAGRCPDTAAYSTSEPENVSPAFSPDGRRLLFQSNRGGADAIYVMTLASCAVTRVTGGNSPDWSPDGKRIVFEHTMRYFAERIFVARADGSHPRQVTRGPTKGPAQHDDFFPAWSPRGDRIAFDRETDDERTGVEQRNVYVVRPDGTGLERLTTGFDAGPAWSPDGRRIAWSCGLSLCVMNSHGSRKRRITAGSRNGDIDPAWAPDGKRLVFVRSGRAYGLRLHVLRLGGAAARLTGGRGGGDYAPDWSPNGRWIAFARATGDRTTDLFLIRPDGSGLRRLTARR